MTSEIKNEESFSPDAAVMNTPQPRNKSLDVFRAIFILGVMVYHYLVRWAPPANTNDLYHYAYRYDELIELGKFGVHSFFMISGLFIAVTLVRSADAIEFAYKRMYRIYPAFFVGATFTFIVLLFAAPPDFTVGPKDYLATLTLFAGNLGAQNIDGAYWSLTVEMKFYFWVALTFFALRDRFWIGLIGLAFVGALVGLVAPKVGKEILLAPYLSFFLAGIALAFQTSLHKPRQAVYLYLGAASSYLWHWGFVALDDGRILLPNLFVLSCMLAVIVVTVRRIRIDVQPLVYLGLISYEIYLLHQRLGVMLIGAAKRYLGVPDWLAFLSAAGMTIALAAALHHVAQRPVQALFRMAWQRFRHRPAPKAIIE